MAAEQGQAGRAAMDTKLEVAALQVGLLFPFPTGQGVGAVEPGEESNAGAVLLG